MKRGILIATFLFLSCILSAQNISVKSFDVIANDPVAHANTLTDSEGNECAIIKVITGAENVAELKNLKFTTNEGSEVVKTTAFTDMVIVTISGNATSLKISHPTLGNCTQLISVLPLNVYRMSLDIIPKAPVEENIDYNFLVIRARPDNARIFVNDEYLGNGEVSKLLPCGVDHKWRVECSMCHTQTGTVRMNPIETTELAIQMKPAFGWVRITSAPEDKARVFIDDIEVGSTPYQSDKLMSGKHELRVEKEMYKPAVQTITIYDSKTTDIKVTLLPNFAEVKFTTLPEANIYIDHESKGKGSWTGRLKEGTYEVEARLESHTTVKKTVNIIAGQNQTIAIGNPTPIYGKLCLNTQPIGANITIDGKSYGVTPKIINNLLIGQHQILLEKNGCAPLSRTITLSENKMLNIDEAMTTGRSIAVKTDRAGDAIYIDGIFAGNSPIEVNMTYGRHVVKSVRGNFSSERQIDVLQQGGEESVSMTFIEKTRRVNVNGISLDLIGVQGGTFTMGCTSEQGNACDNCENPSHSVELSDFYIGKYEVTQDLWQAVMGSNPSYFKSVNDNSKLPVEQVNYNDVQAFIVKLNKLTGLNFALPTEAQWEYAARGGHLSKKYKYSGSNSINNIAWFGGNSNSRTHIVGATVANELGIFDMSGNVREWCRDGYELYNGTSQVDPVGNESAIDHVVRGGDWSSDAKNCRVTYRSMAASNFRLSNTGFRLVLIP